MDELLTQIISEIRSGWRFRWYGAAAAWAVALVGWAWVAYQPDVYEGSARVYVDTSSVLRPLLNKQIIASDIETRLAYVRQALLGHDYLERVASDNGLLATARNTTERETRIGDFRNAIRIDAVPANRDTARPDGTRDTSSIFTISYRHSNPTVAAAVVANVLQLLIEDTLGSNREGTNTAARFLDDRIREYENRLQQSEGALAEFQKANAGRLPGTEGSYFERMQRERDALAETRRKLNLAESRRNRLQGQLRGEAPVVSTSDSAVKQPPPDSLDARIRDRRAELDRLLLQYTEKHPDVIATRATLARLEQQRAEQLRMARAIVKAVTHEDVSFETLGGAIRDPLSGRSYVYQAMRVTGSGDPLTPYEQTLPGKLPQRKITTGAAASGWRRRISSRMISRRVMRQLVICDWRLVIDPAGCTAGVVLASRRHRKAAA